ncbi:MAG: hypothetical protein IPF99_21565 [Deltaproteobacteria bacterium]|nr:hypothetical protein [Deltaproteobacteria bacterium]
MDHRRHLIDAVHRELAACRACPAMIGPVVHGPAVMSRVLLVGQGARPREGGFGRPFAWTAGKTLFGWFESAHGVDEATFRDRVYIAAVARCFPGKAALPRSPPTPPRAPSTPLRAPPAFLDVPPVRTRFAVGLQLGRMFPTMLALLREQYGRDPAASQSARQIAQAVIDGANDRSRARHLRPVIDQQRRTEPLQQTRRRRRVAPKAPRKLRRAPPPKLLYGGSKKCVENLTAPPPPR